MTRPDNTQIKRHLRQAFPGVAFSVRNGRGTAACWTNIGWTDGPSQKQVIAELVAINAYDRETTVCRTVSDEALRQMGEQLVAPKRLEVLPGIWSWFTDVLVPDRGCLSLGHIAALACQNPDRYAEYRHEAHCWFDALARGERIARPVTVFEHVEA